MVKMSATCNGDNRGQCVALLRIVVGMLECQPTPVDRIGKGADRPKRPARAARVLVIRQLADILNALSQFNGQSQNRAAARLSKHGKLLITRRGEVAEWLKAAVC